MKIFGSIQELVSLVYRKGSSQITLRPNSGTTYAADRAVDLPPGDSAHVLVSEAATQTLTNKSVDGDTNTLSNVAASSIKTVLGDANKVILRDGSGAVVSAQIVNANIDAAAAIALSKLATVTASRALQSDGTGIVSASSVTTTELGHVSGVTSSIQTQLNAKEPTITVLPVSKGGTNSSTSLNNSRVMISSGSAIVEASAITASRALASDAGGLPVASTTTSTELGYVSGVTSAVQTQINAKADTSALTAHTGASTGVHGVTGSVVGTTDTQVLTNKDHDGGTASNSSRVTLPKASKSTLDALTRKQATLVYGSDTNKVYADDGSTLKEIGSGSSGINYLNSQFNADALGTVEVSVGDTLASTTRANPNQWGNSAASALITQSTDSTLRGTTNYLVAFSANAQFVESPLFSIDGQDLAKPLLVQFDVSGVVTADDVQVYIARYNSSNVLQERILVAGTASATSPNSAQVPTAVTTFRGFFIPSSTATDKYAIRWRRNANNTSMRLDTFIVGPQSLAQAAVVTAWQSYTPTFSAGFGTVTSIDAKYQRVGNSLKVSAKFTTGTVAGVVASISIPTGITIDTSSQKKIVGLITTQKSTTADFVNTALAFVDTSDTTVIKFCNVASTGATQNLSSANGNFLWSSSTIQSVQFEVPIAEWSSGTTTLADRAVEEYAWNSAAWGDSSDSSSFGYGPIGAAFTNTDLSTQRTRRVRFNTPVLATDKMEVEIKINNFWVPLLGAITPTNGYGFSGFTYNVANAAGSVGIGLSPVSNSSTDVDVNFGRYCTQNGNGTPVTWSTTIAAADSGKIYWRVRKVQSGAAVGFPVSADNIIVNHNTTATVGTIKSGTYTPSAANQLNCAVTPQVCNYLQVGQVVTVSGYALVDVVAAGTAEYSINLPISSNFTIQGNGQGTSVHAQVGGIYDAGKCTADPASDRMFINWRASGVDLNAREQSFTFTYLIV